MTYRSDRYFVGEFDGLTLQDMVRAFGTKAQADAFQGAVPKLLQDSGFKPMRWDRDGEGCNGNPCIAFTTSLTPVLTATQRTVRSGLRLFGELNVLGVAASATVVVDPSLPYLFVEAKLQSIELGPLKLIGQRSASAAGDTDSTDTGPLLRIEIMLANERPPAVSGIASSITDLFKSGAPTGPELSSTLLDAIAVNATGAIQAGVLLWGAVVSVDIAIGNDGFTAEFDATVGAGGTSGNGFAVNVALSAPFNGLDAQLSFAATATLRADFSGAIGAATADAMLAAGESVMEAANSVRDVAETALAMVGDFAAVDGVQAALRESFDAVVAKGKAVLTRCSDPSCKAALGLMIAAYDEGAKMATASFDAAMKLYEALTSAVASGVASARSVLAELPNADKLWADVVDLVSSAVEVGIPTVESAVFSAVLGCDGDDCTHDDGSSLVFKVNLDATFFAQSVSLNMELEVDLNNIASAATVLAATVEQAVRSIGSGGDRARVRGRHARSSASKDGVSDWLVGNWPSSSRGREPLSQLSLVDKGPQGGGSAPTCSGTEETRTCARSAMDNAATALTSFTGAAAQVQSSVDAMLAAVDAIEVAYGAFEAMTVASVTEALELTSASVAGFNNVVTEQVNAVKSSDVTAVIDNAKQHVTDITKTAAAASTAARNIAEATYDAAVSALTTAHDAATKAAQQMVEDATAALKAIIEAGQKAVEDAQAAIGDVFHLLGDICSLGARKNGLGKESNDGGKPDRCLCWSQCKYPLCTLQSHSNSGWPLYLPVYEMFCAGTKKQEQSVDKYYAAIDKAESDEKAAEEAEAEAKRKAKVQVDAAAAQVEEGTHIAGEALAAAENKADNAAAAAIKRAEMQAAEDVAAAHDDQAKALAALKTNAQEWSSAEQRATRQLEFADGLYSFTEGKYGGDSVALSTTVLWITLEECTKQCSQDAQCDFFNFADPFAMLLVAPYNEVSLPGMCQLGMDVLKAEDAHDSALVSIVKNDNATEGKSVHVYGKCQLSHANLLENIDVVHHHHPPYFFFFLWKQEQRIYPVISYVCGARVGGSVLLLPCSYADVSISLMIGLFFKFNIKGMYHLFKKTYSARVARDGATVQDCHPMRAQELCSGSAACEPVVDGSKRFVCHTACNNNNYRHYAEAAECTSWQKPCHDQGLYEAVPGTASTDRVCKSSYNGLPDECCDATGCSSTAFLHATPGLAIGAAACVDVCPNGTYGESNAGMCRSCSEGCADCTSWSTCTVCTPPQVLNGGKCTLGCSQGAAADDDGSCTALEPCQSGWFRVVPGKQECAICPVGYKCSGGGAPIRCSGSTMTTAPGQSSCTPLVPGFYYDQTAADGGKLQACKAGSACIGDGETYVCGKGWFQPAAQQSDCLATLAACTPGTIEVSVPTSTTDRVCLPDTKAPAFAGCPDVGLFAGAVPGPWLPAEDAAEITLGPITVSDNDRVSFVEPALMPATTIHKLPVGQHDFRYEAKDPANNTAVCEFTVVVFGARSPIVMCPEGDYLKQARSLSASSSSSLSVSVDFENLVSATDAYGAPLSITASPPSGSSFGVGRSVVQVNSEDASGNRGECFFAVVVSLSSSLSENDATDEAEPTTTPLLASSTPKTGNENDSIAAGILPTTDTAGSGSGSVVLIVVPIVVVGLLAGLVVLSVYRRKYANTHGGLENVGGEAQQYVNPAYDSSPGDADGNGTYSSNPEDTHGSIGNATYNDVVGSLTNTVGNTDFYEGIQEPSAMVDGFGATAEPAYDDLGPDSDDDFEC